MQVSEPKRFSLPGFSFSVPPELKLSVQPRRGKGLNVRLEGPCESGHSFALVVMTYTEAPPLEQARAAVLEGLSFVYAGDDGASLAKREPVQRRIGAQSYTGEAFSVEWEGSPRIEAYTFEKAGRVWSVSLQYNASEAARADAVFQPVLDSVE